jgi:hypothetical protein
LPLTTAEQKIRRRGCDRVALSTTPSSRCGSMPGFGYHECGRTPYYPRGHDQIDMVEQPS